MLILGIETSCDETAAAVVRDGCEVLSSVIASQAAIHAVTGGVVPEVAAREHVGAVMPTIDRALREAGVTLAKIDAIAVTYGPGLASSLMSGVATANALAAFTGKPLVGVNHILGHIRANWLGRPSEDFAYPIVTLTASGGHNELVLLHDADAIPELIGESTDDAAGEAFDKVARMLGLPYPGGPAIEKIATTGEPLAEPLPRAWLLPKDVARNFDSVTVGERLRDGRLTLTSFDFSFSGVKSEVRRRVQASGNLTSQQVADLARGFQEAAVDVLATKLMLAAQTFGAKEIHLAGGVSANTALRARVQELVHTRGEGEHIVVRWPERMAYCTDNAAMIAAAGDWLLTHHPDRARASSLDVVPGLRDFVPAQNQPNAPA